MALISKRTAVAGGIDPQVQGPEGVAGAIGTALLAAGWTLAFDYSVGTTPRQPSTPYGVGDRIINGGNRYQVVTAGTTRPGLGWTTATNGPDGSVYLRFLSPDLIIQDKVYFSTGESGNDAVWLHLRPSLVDLRVEVALYQYFSAGFGYNQLGYPGTYSIGSAVPHLPAGVDLDYIIVADKDNAALMIRSTSGATYLWRFLGNLKRLPGTRNTMVTASNYNPGNDVNVDVSPSNPIALGYSAGDVVLIVSQQTPQLPNTLSYEYIPIFARKIKQITTNSIVIDIPIGETLFAGARIGESPILAMSTVDRTTPFYNSSGGTVCLPNPLVDNLYLRPGMGVAGGSVQGAAGYDTRIADFSLSSTILLENSPNARTGRTGIYPYFAWINGATTLNELNTMLGTMDKFWLYSSSHVLWDTARTIKESTTRDFKVLTSGSGQVAIGPLVGGSVTGTLRPIDYMPFDDGVTWSDDFKVANAASIDVSRQGSLGNSSNQTDIYTEEEAGVDDGLVVEAERQPSQTTIADAWAGDTMEVGQISMSALYMSSTLVTAALEEIPLAVDTLVSSWSITGPSTITINSVAWTPGTNEIDFNVSGNFVGSGVYRLTLSNPMGISTGRAHSELTVQFVAILAGSSGSAFNSGYN